jgi:rod shape-determining protein MreC
MSLSLRLSIASLVLIALSLSPLSFVSEKIGLFVSEALHQSSYSLATSIAEELSFFSDLRTLYSENAALESELEQFRGEATRLSEVERENELLRQQLGLSTNLSEGLVLAQVIGLSFEQGGASLIIDKGSGDGVAVGDLVVLENYFVGEVERVESDRSSVMLISDPRTSVAALDQSSPDRTQGIVRGSFGTKLRMGKVLPEEQIAAGDLIISSGLDGNVPRGLILGEVVSVAASEGEILKEAELKLLFDPRKLEEVFIRK